GRRIAFHHRRQEFAVPVGGAHGADQGDIEGRAQTLGDLVGDRDAAARQAEDDGTAICQAFKLEGEQLSRSRAVGEQRAKHHHLHLGLAMAILSATVASRWAISAVSRSSRWPVLSWCASSRLSSS